MRIVIDTNIVVSAFVFGGVVKRKLEHILADERVQIVTSLVMNAELQKVLFREEFFQFQSHEVLESLLDNFLADALIIPITTTFTDCRDPKDNQFLDAAVNGQADYLITGDADLLTLHPFHGVKILTITDFVQQVSG
jgi:putative PIN family toxin of toxin-antitoxin system